MQMEDKQMSKAFSISLFIVLAIVIALQIWNINFPYAAKNEGLFLYSIHTPTILNFNLIIPHGPLIMSGFKLVYILTGDAGLALRIFPFVNQLIVLLLLWHWVKSHVNRDVSLLTLLFFLMSYAGYKFALTADHDNSILVLAFLLFFFAFNRYRNKMTAFNSMLVVLSFAFLFLVKTTGLIAIAGGAAIIVGETFRDPSRMFKELLLFSWLVILSIAVFLVVFYLLTLCYPGAQFTQELSNYVLYFKFKATDVVSWNSSAIKFWYFLAIFSFTMVFSPFLRTNFGNKNLARIAIFSGTILVSFWLLPVYKDIRYFFLLLPFFSVLVANSIHKAGVSRIAVYCAGVGLICGALFFHFYSSRTTIPLNVSAGAIYGLTGRYQIIGTLAFSVLLFLTFQIHQVTGYKRALLIIACLIVHFTNQTSLILYPVFDKANVTTHMDDFYKELSGYVDSQTIVVTDEDNTYLSYLLGKRQILWGRNMDYNLELKKKYENLPALWQFSDITPEMLDKKIVVITTSNESPFLNLPVSKSFRKLKGLKLSGYLADYNIYSNFEKSM